MEEDDEMFMTIRSIDDYTKDNRTAHLTAHSDKSVAYVTNNKRLCTLRFVLLKLTTDRYEASRGLFAITDKQKLLVSYPFAFDATPR